MPQNREEVWADVRVQGWAAHGPTGKAPKLTQMAGTPGTRGTARRALPSLSLAQSTPLTWGHQPIQLEALPTNGRTEAAGANGNLQRQLTSDLR